MNLKLLKKVEELTLYAIGLKEENQKQEEKNKLQEVRLADLEKALMKLSGQ